MKIEIILFLKKKFSQVRTLYKNSIELIEFITGSFSEVMLFIRWFYFHSSSQSPEITGISQAHEYFCLPSVYKQWMDTTTKSNSETVWWTAFQVL